MDLDPDLDLALDLALDLDIPAPACGVDSVAQAGGAASIPA